ncbi:unnamed protein product [Ranitomeya imitator]|uniref:NR LBD domain-containing protein n=1 Tax=Ranitomeya imitator TaxID=111125 RepID=A0ABN9LKZ4_9NEOB|nr:unnamed protein product [Ranitomeya imitator]
MNGVVLHILNLHSSNCLLFCEDGVEVVERLIYLYRTFMQMKVSNEEYVCMKAINFLNQDIQGLSSISQLEQLNKRYWYVCQDFTEYRYPHQPNRFRDLMMCLPEIRYIAGKYPATSGRLWMVDTRTGSGHTSKASLRHPIFSY